MCDKNGSSGLRSANNDGGSQCNGSLSLLEVVKRTTVGIFILDLFYAHKIQIQTLKAIKNIKKQKASILAKKFRKRENH